MKRCALRSIILAGESTVGKSEEICRENRDNKKYPGEFGGIILSC